MAVVLKDKPERKVKKEKTLKFGKPKGKAVVVEDSVVTNPVASKKEKVRRKESIFTETEQQSVVHSFFSGRFLNTRSVREASIEDLLVEVSETGTLVDPIVNNLTPSKFSDVINRFVSKTSITASVKEESTSQDTSDGMVLNFL